MPESKSSQLQPESWDIATQHSHISVDKQGKGTVFHLCECGDGAVEIRQWTAAVHQPDNRLWLTFASCFRANWRVQNSHRYSSC